jgi:hypothetical protein
MKVKIGELENALDDWSVIYYVLSVYATGVESEIRNLLFRRI